MSRFGSQFKQRKPKMKRIQNISLSLTSLQSECGGHQGTPRTLLLALLLLLALTSCQKRPQPTTPDDQKTLIGFSPVSQSAAVKSEPLSSFGTAYQKFGVWGIARSTGQQDYILWEDDDLSPVSYDATPQLYVPDESAYWLSGYTYNFIALAPYEYRGTDLNISSVSNSLSFKYSLSDHEFDLMAAVAKAKVDKSSTHASTQDLIFWHLFSQITVNVSFGKDAQNNQIEGSVSQIKLTDIDTDGVFTISYDNAETNPTPPLKVACDITADGLTSGTVIFHDESGTFNIIPQAVSGFDLRINFKIDEGDGRLVSYEDFKIDLSALDSAVYKSNERYNWNIKIGPKAAISFKVEVEDWTPDTTLPEIDIK